MRPAYIYVNEEPKSLTLAELCEALAGGDLPSQQEDGYYTIRQRDLLRFTRSSQIITLPTERAAVEMAAAS